MFTLWCSHVCAEMPVSKIGIMHVPVPGAWVESGNLSCAGQNFSGERKWTWWSLRRVWGLQPPAMGTVLVVCSRLGLPYGHTADGDPYCRGHTGGDAIWEMMPLMWAFLSSVRRLLPSTWEYLCKYKGNCFLTCIFKTTVILNKRLLWLSDLFMIVPLKYT